MQRLLDTAQLPIKSLFSIPPRGPLFSGKGRESVEKWTITSSILQIPASPKRGRAGFNSEETMSHISPLCVSFDAASERRQGCCCARGDGAGALLPLEPPLTDTCRDGEPCESPHPCMSPSG